MPRPDLKQLLSRPASGQETTLGAFVFSPDADISAVYAHAGFDFVIIDLEHGANDIRSTIAHIRACHAHQIAPIARLGVTNFPDAGRLLDAGIDGFMLPHVGLAGYGSDQVMRAMRYAPEGSRPTCTGVPSAGFGLTTFSEAAARANSTVVTLGLIEDASVVADLDRVLDGVELDCVIPGPADLATSLGCHGQLRHPDVLAATRTIQQGARARNIAVGQYINDPAEIADDAADPIGVYVYSIDYKALAKHLKAVETEARTIRRRHRG